MLTAPFRPLVSLGIGLLAACAPAQYLPITPNHSPVPDPFRESLPLIALTASGLLAVLLWSIVSARKRAEELRQFAQDHNLDFNSATNRELHRQLGFGFLAEGYSQRAYNIMTGLWRNHPVIVFDYRWESGNDKNQSDHRLTAIVVESPFPIRPILIRPEGVLDRMAEFFGADDIDFELAEFNRRFFVKSPHRRWAFDLLHPRAMEFLLSQPDYWLESNERQFIIWRKQLLTPAEIGEAANLVVNLLSMVPDFARTPNYVAVPSQGNAAR